MKLREYASTTLSVMRRASTPRKSRKCCLHVAAGRGGGSGGREGGEGRRGGRWKEGGKREGRGGAEGGEKVLDD